MPDFGTFFEAHFGHSKLLFCVAGWLGSERHHAHHEAAMLHPVLVDLPWWAFAFEEGLAREASSVARKT